MAGAPLGGCRVPGLVVGAVAVHLWRIISHGYFFLDDWGLIDQSGSLGGMVQPYNDHMSLVILVVYRALVEAFGFVYRPFRTVGLVCLFPAIPVSFYVTTRRLLGPPLAAAARWPCWRLQTSSFDRRRSTTT